jgi:hypothetical protein
MNFISKVLRKYSKTQKATSKKCVFQTFNQLAQITQSINLVIISSKLFREPEHLPVIHLTL